MTFTHKDEEEGELISKLLALLPDRATQTRQRPLSTTGGKMHQALLKHCLAMPNQNQNQNQSYRQSFSADIFPG
jgi:hypothetical protein